MSKSPTPRVITSPHEMREATETRRRAGARIGLVPTMGALHEGHLSLVRASQARCDLTVVTIFVNPTQFGPNEDFSRYPRTMEQDLALLAGEGVNLVYCPTPDVMYPPGFSTYIEPPAAAIRLEGELRPGHFRGVCTVVLKLFQAAPADQAFFGQKDYQQALVIKQMARDLDLPIEIIVCPIIRDANGLALSSRNRYLSPEQRDAALGLSRALAAAKSAATAGERNAESIRALMRQILLGSAVNSIDYVSIADTNSLEEIEQLNMPAVALLAVQVGATRLIDNEILSPPIATQVKE